MVHSGILFYDPSLAGVTPEVDPRIRLSLEDIKISQSADTASVDWNKKGQALFTLRVKDPKGSGDGELVDLFMGEASKEFAFQPDGNTASAKGEYAVRMLGPTQRYMTILSVVNEPTVGYTMLGVGITVFGALLTFLFRYRAFYGLWDEATQSLRMALVPRWGQSPVKAEFDELVALLSHGGKAPIPANAATIEKETFAQVPETANVAPSRAEAG